MRIYVLYLVNLIPYTFVEVLKDEYFENKTEYQETESTMIVEFLNDF